MIYFVFDTPKQSEKSFIDYLDDLNINVIYQKKKCNRYKDIYKEAFSLYRKTSCEDTVIFWYDFMAVAFYQVCKLMHTSRKIVAINIMLKNKRTIKNRIAKFMYKHALASKSFTGTVTATQYGEELNRLLGLEEKYYIIHDLYKNEYEIKEKNLKNRYDVFCGGKNGRDWKLMMDVAISLPDKSFIFVMSKKDYQKYDTCNLKNVKVVFDIPYSKFIEKMCSSAIVVLPLNTNAPAGLIVMFQATANGKLVITSDTPCTREYFKNHERGVLCKNNKNEWIKKIEYYINNIDIAGNISKNAKLFLSSHCTEKHFADDLRKLIIQIEDINR